MILLNNITKIPIDDFFRINACSNTAILNLSSIIYPLGILHFPIYPLLSLLPTPMQKNSFLFHSLHSGLNKIDRKSPSLSHKHTFSFHFLSFYKIEIYLIILFQLPGTSIIYLRLFHIRIFTPGCETLL